MDSFFVLEDGVTYLITEDLAYFVTEDHTGTGGPGGGGRLLLKVGT